MNGKSTELDGVDLRIVEGRPRGPGIDGFENAAVVAVVDDVRVVGVELNEVCIGVQAGARLGKGCATVYRFAEELGCCSRRIPTQHDDIVGDGGAWAGEHINADVIETLAATKTIAPRQERPRRTGIGRNPEPTCARTGEGFASRRINHHLVRSLLVRGENCPSSRCCGWQRLGEGGGRRGGVRRNINAAVARRGRSIHPHRHDIGIGGIGGHRIDVAIPGVRQIEPGGGRGDRDLLNGHGSGSLGRVGEAVQPAHAQGRNRSSKGRVSPDADDAARDTYIDNRRIGGINVNAGNGASVESGIAHRITRTIGVVADWIDGTHQGGDCVGTIHAVHAHAGIAIAGSIRFARSDVEDRMIRRRQSQGSYGGSRCRVKDGRPVRAAIG